MRKISGFVLGTLIASALSLPARASNQPCIDLFNSYRAEKVALGVQGEHLPTLKLPKTPVTDSMIVSVHGIFESPAGTSDVTDSLAAKGFGSISVLLPGHWEANWKKLDEVNFMDWTFEVERAMYMAQCFSPKVFLAGHSLGGLLSLQASLAHPDVVLALLMWAPALQESFLIQAATQVGPLLGIDGNILTMNRPGPHQAYYSPHAGQEVEDLIDYVGETYSDSHSDSGHLAKLGVYKKITIPTFVIYTANDPAISDAEVADFYSELLPKKSLIYYDKKSPVWHVNINKAPDPTKPNSRLGYPAGNPFFEDMMSQVSSFLSDVVR